MTGAGELIRAGAAQETADNWPSVIVVLSPGWRVIVCRDGLQWIIQHRKKGGAERPWRAVRYCRTRKALLRLCAAFCEPLDPAAQAVLGALPKTIGRAGK